MCRILSVVVVGLVAIFAASDALALTVDFSLTPDGFFASYTEQGVTFTAVDGGATLNSDVGLTPNLTRGLIDLADPFDPQSELRADIAGGAASVSVDLGDFDSDSDRLFLEIFNSSDTLLDSTFIDIDSNFIGMLTLGLSDPNIAYAIFGARLAELGSSVYADNFTWTPSQQQVVPEPSTVLLITSGFLGLFLLRRFGRPRA